MLIIPDAKRINRIIWSPMRQRVFGYTGYRFMTGNLFWYFIESIKVHNKMLRFLFIQKTGELRICIAPWSEQEVDANIGKTLRLKKIE